MWEPIGKALDHDQLGSLEPSEVLYEFAAEPLTFVAHDPEGEPLLVHNLSAWDRVSRYVVSAVDERILGDLKAGRIDIVTALDQPRCWVADVAEDASVKSVRRVDFVSIPSDLLPDPGAMLTPDLEPLFRVRLIGPGLGPGKT